MSIIFKRIIVFMGCLYFSCQVKAQYPFPDPSTSASTTNLIPATPNAGALGKYVDYPVSLFTGIPEISIPIYEIKDGGCDLPISLSYHASGIKVEEIASWVGTGWTLNAGGAVMRTVRGRADEGTYGSTGEHYGPTGYYLDYGLKTFPRPPFTDAAGNEYGLVNGGTDSLSFAAKDLGFGTVDGESDLYTFNFNGISGKFIFDENRTPHLLTDDNVTISVNFNGTDFSSWTITTSEGVKYFFGENGSTEQSTPQYGFSGSPGKGPITCWYLTTIVYPDNKDTIHLSYSAETYFATGLGAESYSIVNNNPSNPPSNICGMGYDAQGNPKPALPTNSSVQGVRLSEIRSANTDILFEADNTRKDLNNLTRELDKIKIYSLLTGKCIKQYRFGYGYFVSTSPWPFASSTPLDHSDSLRLKLLTLTEFSGDSSVVKPPYIFSYQDSFALPRRLSFDQDHWGFSNSATPINRNLIPGAPWLTNIGCTTALGANREPAWPQMSAGVLTGIKDPLGSFTSFQYEANQTTYSPLPTGGTLVGGLRIKSIKVTDSLTGNVSVRQYQYSNGQLYKMPNYCAVYNNEFLYNCPTGAIGGYIGTNPSSNLFGYMKQSQSIVPMQDANGCQIGYGTVTEIFGANGENGKKVYTYDQGIPGAEATSAKLNASQFMTTDYFNANYGGPKTMYLGDSLFNLILPQNLIYSLGMDNSRNYPSAPEQVDLSRGNLLQAQTFDAAGNLLESVTNQYDTSLHENYWTRGVKGFQISGGGGCAPTAPLNLLTYYKLHTGISHLMYTVTTNYEGGNPVTDTIKYSYESPYHTLPTKITNLRSNGDSIIQKTYYSFDYSPTATPDGIFGVMQQMNLLSPVAKEVWENNTMTGSQVTAYSDFNTNATLGHVIKPSKIYMLATNTPLTTSQAGETAAYSGLRYALLPNSYYTERVDLRFDSVGNAAQENKVKDKITSYQWGYGGIYPVAKVDNAVNTYSTGDSSLAQYKSFQLAASSGQGTTQNYSFSIYPTGTLSLSIGYGGNPGTNPTYNVGYVISGSGGNITGTFCKGTGCPAQYTATFVNYPNLPAGNYSISITPYSNVNTSNLPLNMSCSYSSLGPVSSGIKEFFYDGFEENNNANVIIGSAHTGKRYWSGSTYTTSFNLPDSKTYTIQWWKLSGGIWIFNQQGYTGPTTLTGPVDDIRIFPSDALMSTYTYDPAIGMTSQTDPSGHSTNYFYDSLRRLSYIKDQDGNILKKICYNFNGQATSCTVTPPSGFFMSAIDNNSTYTGYTVTLTNLSGGPSYTFTVAAHGTNSIGPITPGMYNITVTPPPADTGGLMTILSINGNSSLFSSGSISTFSNINIGPSNYNTINIY
ncbi:MAG: hypothetical protein ACTHOB_17380 [Ginsengibacter sp.]